jgi:hypothetical protein
VGAGFPRTAAAAEPALSIRERRLAETGANHPPVGSDAPSIHRRPATTASPTRKVLRVLKLVFQIGLTVQYTLDLAVDLLQQSCLPCVDRCQAGEDLIA